MKKTLLRLICLTLAIFMIFGMVGCGSEKTTSVNEDMGDFELDFGTESTQTDATQSGSDAGTGNDANTNGDTASKGNANVNTTTEDLDKLSWNQLLAKMPKELKGTTITIASWNPAKEVTGAESVIANFEKLTGIKVKWNVVSYAGYEDKIAALVNSNSSPDLIRYYSPSIHRMYLCQDVKTATGQDFKGDIWDSRVTSQYTIKGKIYGVNLKNTFVQQPKVLMYRKSVVESAGIEDPYLIWKRGEWTWDKFLEICKEFQENTSSTGYQPWITNVGIDLLDFAGIELFKFDGSKYTNNLKDPEVYKALKQMCDLKAADIVSSAVRDQKVFKQGTTLFMTFNSIANRKTNANLAEVKQENDLYCVPLPAIKGRENIQNISELEAYGIPKGAKNPGAVYYFLRYYLDANNYDANAFFVNKQAYEVYQDAMNKSEFYIATRDDLLDLVTETTGGIAGLSDYIRTGGSAAQLQKELDSINPLFELAVKKGNETLAKFK